MKVDVAGQEMEVEDQVADLVKSALQKIEDARSNPGTAPELTHRELEAVKPYWRKRYGK